MGDTYVISGLTATRVELLSRARFLEDQARQTRADLAHIDAALRLFDSPNPQRKAGRRGSAPARWPGCAARFSAMPPNRCRLRPWCARSWCREAMDAEDRQQRSAIILRTLQALHRMAKRDDVTRVGKGVGCCGRRPASRLAPVVAWSHRPLGDHWGIIVSCGGCCHLERS